MIRWADLIEPVSVSPIPARPLTLDQELWQQHGHQILRDFLPPALIDAYEAAYETAGVGPDGWEHCTPYMDCPALLDLCCCPELATVLERILGEPMGVHLNLTGWVSTERNWHQDGYLNPPGVGDRYAAVWMALGDINPDSGPFEFVPGSHLWGEITREQTWQFLTPQEQADPMWPKITERFLTEAAEAEITRRGAKVEQFIGHRGDVLIWHPRLLHRGSAPRVPGLQRKALIAHFSAVTARPDMPPAERHGNGGWFFPIREFVPVR